MEQVKGQLTLFQCRKVVSGKSWVVFSEEDIVAHKKTLLDPNSSMHLLLNTLRKLDCYKLDVTDISRTEIGRAAATVAALHPRQEVVKLAAALVEKWRVQGDGQLFSHLEYDAEAAAAAPEGDPSEFKVQAPPPPPPPPEATPQQPTRVQPPRGDRAQRLKDEAAFLDGSDFEGISESSSSEDDSGSDADSDWQPGTTRRKKQSGASSQKKKAKQE